MNEIKEIVEVVEVNYLIQKRNKINNILKFEE
jgi:hypothetical protein